MKLVISLLSVFLFSSFAKADEMATAKLYKVSCSEGEYSVEINLTNTGSVEEYMFTLFHNGQVVGPMLNPISLSFAGFEDSFLNAFVWSFETADASSVLGVGLPGVRTPVVGTYTNGNDGVASDLFIEAGGHYMTGSTVPCSLNFK